MRQARLDNLEASDGLEAAKSALVTCMARFKNPSLRYAQSRVQAAVAPVLAPEADRVLADAERLRSSSAPAVADHVGDQNCRDLPGFGHGAFSRGMQNSTRKA
jgi:hypothetical protein